MPLKINHSEWRTLPYASWNVRTAHAMFAELNREHYDVNYVPFRNWAVERGMIKNALAEHGPELLRAAVEEAFRTYRPTQEYPLLTAGFAIAYRVNALIPKLKIAQSGAVEPVDVDTVRAWL